MKRQVCRTTSLMLCFASLLAACSSPAPISNACGWEHQIIPDSGFETRWTRNEKVQIVEHNADVAKFCP
jgi:hypothetical protein